MYKFIKLLMERYDIDEEEAMSMVLSNPQLHGRLLLLAGIIALCTITSDILSVFIDDRRDKR